MPCLLYTSVFDSLLHTFGTAGTGGFGIKNSSVAYYNSAYIDYVIGIFMMLFGLNFNVYFLIIARKFSQIKSNDEVKWYIGMMIGAAAVSYTHLYSFYVVYMYRSKLDEMDYIKLTFYLMIIMSIGTYIFGLTTDSLVFAEMDYKAWILSVAISLIITLGAVPLFQVGVRCEGASTAGIVSAFEPITSIILGAIFLGETMGLVQYIGGGLIILGVVLAEKYG